jgi:hypothetical protein
LAGEAAPAALDGVRLRDGEAAEPADRLGEGVVSDRLGGVTEPAEEDGVGFEAKLEEKKRIFIYDQQGFVFYIQNQCFDLIPEAESKEKHGEWDPVPELTITSPCPLQQ